MTDRHAGYVVTLDRDIREDDAEATIAALHQIKGVIGVEPLVESPELHLARMRARAETREKFRVFWKDLFDT